MTSATTPACVVKTAWLAGLTKEIRNLRDRVYDDIADWEIPI